MRLSGLDEDVELCPLDRTWCGSSARASEREEVLAQRIDQLLLGRLQRRPNASGRRASGLRERLAHRDLAAGEKQRQFQFRNLSGDPRLSLRLDGILGS